MERKGFQPAQMMIMYQNLGKILSTNDFILLYVSIFINLFSNFSDTVKFDFSQELKRRLHTSSRGSRGSKGNAQDGGTPTEMEALRMARALKWMAKLESCNQR